MQQAWATREFLMRNSDTLSKHPLISPDHPGCGRLFMLSIRELWWIVQRSGHEHQPVMAGCIYQEF